jgi:hypothetical protein
VAEYPELGVTTNDGFELAGDSAYLIRREGDTGETPLFLNVLDIGNNPARPRRVSSLDLGVRSAGEYGGIAHADGRLFILVSRAGGGARRSRLIVVDARLPGTASPVPRVRLKLVASAHFSQHTMPGVRRFPLVRRMHREAKR